MNTVLHLADSFLQYRRGKQTGLIGLAGIGVSILTFAFWPLLSQLFSAIGITKIFTSTGIITTDDGGALIVYKILFYLFFVSLCLPVLGGILLILNKLVLSTFGLTITKAIYSPLLYVLFFPVFFVLLFLRKNTKNDKRSYRSKTPELMLLSVGGTSIEISDLGEYSIDSHPVKYIGLTNDKQLVLIERLKNQQIVGTKVNIEYELIQKTKYTLIPYIITEVSFSTPMVIDIKDMMEVFEVKKKIIKTAIETFEESNILENRGAF